MVHALHNDKSKLKNKTHLCLYSYIFIHIHTHSYIFIHIHTHSCTFIHIHIHSYTFIHIHTYSYTFIPMQGDAPSQQRRPRERGYDADRQDTQRARKQRMETRNRKTSGLYTWAAAGLGEKSACAVKISACKWRVVSVSWFDTWMMLACVCTLPWFGPVAHALLLDGSAWKARARSRLEICASNLVVELLLDGSAWEVRVRSRLEICASKWESGFDTHVTLACMCVCTGVVAVENRDLR